MPSSDFEGAVPRARAADTGVGFSDTLRFVLVASDEIAGCWGNDM